MIVLFGFAGGFATTPWCEITLRDEFKGDRTTRCLNQESFMFHVRTLGKVHFKKHPVTSQQLGWRIPPKRIQTTQRFLMSSWSLQTVSPNDKVVWQKIVIHPIILFLPSHHCHVDQLFHRPIIFPPPSWFAVLCPNHVNLRFFLLWSFLCLDLQMLLHGSLWRFVYSGQSLKIVVIFPAICNISLSKKGKSISTLEN